ALLKPLESFPGINVSANTFLTERVNETFSGYTTPVAVNIYGNDLKVIDETAQAIAEALRHIPGAASVQLQAPPGLPQLTIRRRRGPGASAARSCRVGALHRGGDRALAVRGHPQLAQPPAPDDEPAIQLCRRHGGGVSFGRRLVARFARRVRHPLRHHLAQRD